MEYTKLVNTDLLVPKMSLGTMTFGGQTEEKESLKIMEYGFEKGITLFDTANIYTDGASETIVAKGIKNKRDQIILASKVGYESGTKLNGVCLTKEAIFSEIDKSLKRLDTDYVDMYYFHAPDYNTPMEESLEAMAELVEQGKVRYVAVSNHAAWQLADMMAICEREGFAKPVMTQNVYNAITRSLETELVPFLDKHSMGLSVYNPIAAGLLTGKHKNGPVKNSRLSDNKIYKNRYWSEANILSTEKLMEIAEEAGITILELAFKWCTANPKVTSIISGVSKLSQLEQNIKAMEGPELSQEVLEKCDKVWKEHTGNPFGYNR